MLDPAPVESRWRQHAQDDVEIDLRAEEAADDGERWLTVSEAAELVGVSGAAIRGWYRSGRIPTQRAEGDHGAQLVPLSVILRLGVDADEVDDDGEPVVDLDANSWSVETSIANDEAATMRQELDDARRQVAFLREQLAETAAAERAARARAEAAETELQSVRDSTGAAWPVDSSREPATRRARRARR